jgi:hypothetical protein
LNPAAAFERMHALEQDHQIEPLWLFLLGSIGVVIESRVLSGN